MKKLIFLFSAVSFFLINILLSKVAIITDIIVSIFLFIFAIIKKIYKNCDIKRLSENKGISLLSFVIALFLGARFSYQWAPSGKLLKLAFNSLIIKDLLLTAVTVLLAIGTFIFLSLLFLSVCELMPKYEEHSVKKDTKVSIVALLIIFITSVICITVCSKSSPIYAFNNWDDANCFFTVGKAITRDIVMYKDIFEQKGPLLYFLNTLAYLISPTTFFGVYLIEIVSCFFFLLFTYKTICLFDKTNPYYLIPIISLFVFSSSALSHGSSAEELCLPLIGFSNYIGFKSIINNEKISVKNCFFIGLVASAVLWIKFSLLGFFIGFGLFFLIYYLYKKWIKDLFIAVCSIFGGVLSLSVPILIYFVVNNAVSDLFEVYFYDNLFIYSVDKGANKFFNLYENLSYGLSSFVENYVFAIIFILLGIVLLLNRKKQLSYLLVTLISTFFFVYCGGRNYIYYSLVLSVFIPYGVLLLNSICKFLLSKIKFKVIRKKRTQFLTVPLMLILPVLLYLFSPNTYMLKYSKEDLPQFKFNEIISQTENPTLLNYDFLDGGFYTVSNIMPNCKFFCGLNIPYNEIKETQDYFIENKLVDYVVTREKVLSNEQQENYECVAVSNFEEKKNETLTYYLYKKR